jgi:hypothetical protein
MLSERGVHLRIMPWRRDADEGTGFLRDDQKLVLVQPTQYSRNLTASCQNRAGLFKLSAHGKPETPALDDDFATAVERPHV